MHLLHLLDDEFLGDSCRHVLERSLSGYGCDAKVAAAEDGKALGTFAQASFNVFLVALELEALKLCVLVVYRCGNEHVEELVAVVGHGSVKCLDGCRTRFLSRHAHVNLYLLVYGWQEVDSSIFSIFCFLDDGELGRQIHRLAVISCHFRRTVDDRGTILQHLWLTECLKNEFVSDTVGISVSDGHSNLFAVHLSFYFIVEIAASSCLINIFFFISGA